MSALPSDTNQIPEKYPIPKEYLGKGQKLTEEELVHLGESQSDTIEYIKHYFSYVWEAITDGKDNASNTYKNFYKDKAFSLIKSHNDLYIRREVGSNIDDISMAFIRAHIPQGLVFSEEKPLPNEDKQEIHKAIKLLNLKEQLDISNAKEWISKFIPIEDLKKMEFNPNILNSADSQGNRLENLNLWIKLNDLNMVFEGADISSKAFADVVQFILDQEVAGRKTDIKEMTPQQINETTEFIKMYKTLPTLPSDMKGIEVSKKLYILEKGCKENNMDAKDIKAFVLKDKDPVATSVLRILPSDRSLTLVELGDIGTIKNLSTAGGIDVSSIFSHCDNIAAVKEALKDFLDQEKTLISLAPKMSILPAELKENPQIVKELASLVSLYNWFSSDKETIDQRLVKEENMPISTYIAKLSNDPVTKKYQAIQGSINAYVELGVDMKALEELKVVLLKISPDQFDKEFATKKEDFNKDQLELVHQKWKAQYGPIFSAVLYAQLSDNVKEGREHYLKDYKLSKTSNQLSHAAEKWAESELQEEFFKLIETSWVESNFGKDLQQIQKEKDPEKLQEFIDKFAKSVLEKLNSLKVADFINVKRKFNEAGLKEVYLDHFLQDLFLISDESIGNKLNRMKVIPTVVQPISDTYGIKVTEKILQGVDIKTVHQKSLDILAKLNKLGSEYAALSDKVKAGVKFQALLDKSISSNPSITDAIQSIQLRINEAYLTKVFPDKFRVSSEVLNAVRNAIPPDVLAGNASYLDSDFGKKALPEKIKQLAPYVPSWKAAGFDEAFVGAYLKKIPDDQLETRLQGISSMAKWVNKQQTVREKQLYKELLLEFHPFAAVYSTQQKNLDAFMGMFTTLVNTAQAQDPNGIYSPSVIARGLRKGLDNDRPNIKVKGPEEILTAFIANHRTGWVLANRFNDNTNAKFAQIYFTLFAEDTAKAVIGEDYSEKHQKFLKELFIQTNQIPANEAVKNHVKDIIEFALPLLETGAYQDYDIINEILTHTSVNVAKLNQQEKIAPLLNEKIVESLMANEASQSKGLIRTLKADPFLLVQTFASKLVSQFVPPEDKEYAEGFEKSLSALKDTFNRNPLVIKGMAKVVSLLDNAYLPLTDLAEDGDVKGIFELINGALEDVKTIRVDKKGRLIKSTEANPLEEMETEKVETVVVDEKIEKSVIIEKKVLEKTRQPAQIIQPIVFGLIKKASQVISKSSNLDKKETTGEGIKSVMSWLSTLVKWRGWISSLVKTWLPAIATALHKTGGGNLLTKVAELGVPFILDQIVANMELEDATKEQIRDLIAKAPGPVINGALMALPGIIEKIQIDKYLDFLEFIDTQFTKEQPDDPLKVQEKLVDFVRTLSDDISKFTPMLESAVEATMATSDKE